MSKKFEPDNLLQAVSQMIEAGKGARIVMYRGTVPVFRAKIKSAEINLGKKLLITSTDTEVHATMGTSTSWNRSGQHGDTRTGITLSDFPTIVMNKATVSFTQSRVGAGPVTSYSIEPITD